MTLFVVFAFVAMIGGVWWYTTHQQNKERERQQRVREELDRQRALRNSVRGPAKKAAPARSTTKRRDDEVPLYDSTFPMPVPTVVEDYQPSRPAAFESGRGGDFGGAGAGGSWDSGSSRSDSCSSSSSSPDSSSSSSSSDSGSSSSSSCD
jgi:hypothetical protein